MFKIVLQLLIATLLVSHAMPLVKTGQTTSYSDFDDGYHQTGITRSYSRSGDIVIDNVTGLEWQDDENVTRVWDDALSYCADLPLDGGGWRLPSIEELETIVDYGRYNPSLSEGVFLSYVSSEYWSSTVNVNNTFNAWYVYFSYGYSNNYGFKARNYYVRCVRDGGQ